MIRAQKRKRVALPHFRKEAHGQASIEFIFTVVFLVLFILGMIEVLMVVYTYSVLADSAMEGTQGRIGRKTGPLPQEKWERRKCDSAACLKSHAAGHSNEQKVVRSLRGKKSYRAFFCTEEIPRGVYHD